MRSTDRNTHSPTSSRFTRRTRSGFTLLEVLVATAVTLLMMVALAKIFSDIGRSMKQGRAALELNGRLRDVTYRLQTALNNATANPNSRPGTVEGRGYMELYDGSTTEHTAQQLVGPQVNRFGDVDDISMFTARAGDVWFTGKVPRFILERRAPVNTDNNGNGRVDDYESESLISVGSQHAEIVAFMQPVVAGEKAVFAGVLNPQRDSRYLVGSPAFYQDNDGNGLPDAWRLHYRTLIIRPDLNLADGALPFNSSNGYFMVGPQFVTLPDGSRAPLPTPNCDMVSVHGVCDLSMRRVFDGNNSTRDRVAANSLQDLENPASRFAHVQLPIPNTSSTTMPVLALTPSLPVHASDPVRFDFTAPSPFVSGNGLLGSGFLHPAFSLHSYIYDTQEIGERVGEDILANDVLAFDIKVYDPGVPILASFGIDGGPGVSIPGEPTLSDDDGNGTPDDAAEIGWAGSDDLVLSPNDPGYGAYLTQLIANNVSASSRTVGAGEYVDIGWARKLAGHGISLDARMNLSSAFSAISPSAFGTAAQGFTTGLLKSGRALLPVGNPPILYQPSYDTWSNIFERDGVLQSYRGTNLLGTVRNSGSAHLYGIGSNELAAATPAWRQSSIDAAVDGLDNDGSSGADDQQEFETSPPFDVPLRGIKISVRMENPGAREVRELPVSVEFVSH